jgi:hypothetical protein
MSRPPEDIDSDNCHAEIICCMPCVACFVTGEQLCKSLCLGLLLILSCPCLSAHEGREISPVIHQSEINEIVTDIEEIENDDDIDYAEETKDATYV